MTTPEQIEAEHAPALIEKALKSLRELSAREMRIRDEHNERIGNERERYLTLLRGVWERRDALGNEIERLRDLAANDQVEFQEGSDSETKIR